MLEVHNDTVLWIKMKLDACDVSQRNSMDKWIKWATLTERKKNVTITISLLRGGADCSTLMRMLGANAPGSKCVHV